MERKSEGQQSEFFIVLKEIMSLERERRDLLASLTPGVSVWKREGVEPQLWRIAGKDYGASQDAASVLAVRQLEQLQLLLQEKKMEPASPEEQLGRYLASIVQDTEDMCHRMLSMAAVVVKPGAATFSSYKADELVNSTSRLMHACNELYKDTNDNEEEEEQRKNTFLDLYNQYLEIPWEHQNELAVVVTKEEEEEYEKGLEKEKKRKEEAYLRELEKWMRWRKIEEEYEKGKGKGKEKEEEKKQEKKKEDDPSTMEYLKKGMDISQKIFEENRDSWESIWASKIVRCGGFRDPTTLSPMHFTHYTPDTIPSAPAVTGSTLQIYSIEILALKKELKWPLKVYGAVAARDTVDRNRNILFSRSRLYYQELDENGPFLCLTGPSRAIVALGPVDFEVELEIEEGELKKEERAESQDRELISLSKRYDGADHTSLRFEGRLCTAVLRLEQISTAVQATIVGVRVVKGRWPFKYGCRVACFAAADVTGPTSRDVVLLDWRGKEMPVGSNDYLHLPRNVVSVNSQGTLKVVIQAYSKKKARGIAQEGQVHFHAKHCQTTEDACLVGTSRVEVVVAWSLLVKEKRDLMVDRPAVEP